MALDDKLQGDGNSVLSCKSLESDRSPDELGEGFALRSVLRSKPIDLSILASEQRLQLCQDMMDQVIP